jgi:hypothetical protein
MEVIKLKNPKNNKRRAKAFLIAGSALLFASGFFGRDLYNRGQEDQQKWNKVRSSEDYAQAQKVVEGKFYLLEDARNLKLHALNNSAFLRKDSTELKEKFPLEYAQFDSFRHCLDNNVIKLSTEFDSARKLRDNAIDVESYNQFRNGKFAGDIRSFGLFFLSGALTSFSFGLYSRYKKKEKQ